MNRIYVFSSTGTSLQLAKEIIAQNRDFEIVSIPKLMKQKTWSIDAEKAGFVFPCYYGEMPKLVREFISQAKTVSVNYTFGVATAGGDIGYSLKKLDKALKERGSSLNYGKDVVIASNYMNGWYYNMLMPSKDKLQKRIDAAKELCKKIANDVNNSCNSSYKKSLAGYVMPHIISPSRYVKDTRPWDSEFSTNKNCNGCGICAKVCPVDNIVIENSRPVFNHNCQRCMACVQYCSQSAFEIEGQPMDKAKYTYPEIGLKEIIDFNRSI